MTHPGSPQNLYLVFTCEHARNCVPKELQPLFAGKREVLETHRGYDLGALSLGKALAEAFDTPFFTSSTTRLVCDLNRSLGHPTLFSEFTQNLPPPDKKQIIQSYYLPHRMAVEADILQNAKRERRILHIGVHTFTPCLDGQHRKADIGLLYDPHRALEKEFCLRWRDALGKLDGTLQIRRNYPYRGQSDSLPTYFRRILPENAYLGIELEVNQRLFLAGRANWKRIGLVLVGSLQDVLGERLI